MLRPVAVIGITAQTMQILNDRLHKADDKNKTLDGKNVQTHTEYSSQLIFGFD